MNLAGLAPYMSVIEIILAVVITVLVVVQAKGSDLSGFLGGSDTSTGGFRTRRGVEATLYKVTIGFSIAFFVWTILTFIALGQAA